MPKFIMIAQLLLMIIPAFALSSTSDSARYIFPDNFNGGGIGYEKYSEIVEMMDQISIRNGDLSVESYTAIKSDLVNLGTNGNSALIPYVNRRLAILEWMHGGIDSVAASKKLIALSDTYNGEQIVLTKEIAMVILLRDGHFPEATDIFKGIDPISSPQYGWFAFEVIKYGGQYGGEFTPRNSHAKPEVSAADSARRREFADFVDTIFLPSMIRSVNEMSNNRSAMDRVQLVGAIEQLASVIHRVLAPRDLTDVSRKAIDDLLPRTIDVWSLGVSKLGNQSVISVDGEYKKIASYKESVLPELKNLLSKAQFREEFGPYIVSSSGNGNSIDSITGDGDFIAGANVPSTSAITTQPISLNDNTSPVSIVTTMNSVDRSGASAWDSWRLIWISVISLLVFIAIIVVWRKL